MFCKHYFLQVFILLTGFLYSEELRVYQMYPPNPVPGTPFVLYGSGFAGEGVYLILDGAYFFKDSPDVISWENNRIEVFLPNTNGKGTITLSDGKTTQKIGYSPGKTGTVEYFNPVTYTLQFTIKVKDIKRLNREKGSLLLYVPQPLLSDEISSREILEINHNPDYIQNNGILIYTINPDTTSDFTLVERLKITTWYKKYDFESFKNQTELDKTISPYTYYTKQEPPYIIPYDPAIIKLRNSIISGKEPPLEKAAKIYSWVTAKMEHEYPPEDRSPLYSIENGKGDCLSDAYLFATLIRSAGLPIRFNAGYIFYHAWDVGGLHFWEEVLIPGAGWITFDPSFGHSPGFLVHHEYPSNAPFYAGGVDGHRMAFSKGITALYKPDNTGKLVFFRHEDHMQVPRLYYSNPVSHISYTLEKRLKILEIKTEYPEDEDWFKKQEVPEVLPVPGAERAE